jgi:ectoine hydroxylase-related dioxygenase (phytanoyl-CoA dioxygenase family)
MLKLPPDSGRFVFYRNTYDFFHSSSLPSCSSEPFRYNNRITPPLREGDIVFFPSVLEHYVTVNESDETRATISANFTIKERTDEEKQD